MDALLPTYTLRSRGPLLRLDAAIPAVTFCEWTELTAFPARRTYFSALEERAERDEMKLQLLTLITLSAALPLLAAEESPLLKTPKDKISYSIGMNIGQ